jgi:antitoxin ParD1/3/4
MAAIRVRVPDDVGALIEARVASGEYASASDYVSELILRDQPLSAEGAKWLEEFEASIDRGIADSKAGRVVGADVVLARLQAKYAAMIEAAER